MAAALFSFLRSLLPRRAGRPLPTMHSLRVHGGQGCPSYGSLRSAAKQRPLRVVRGAPGRLVISGRMADVCAELERLAALEDGRPQAFAPAR
jgi:hypothetical protein